MEYIYIVAMTNDMGPINVGLWKELNIAISTVKKVDKNKVNEFLKRCFSYIQQIII